MRNLKFIHDTLSKPFAERRKLMRNAASGELKLYEGKIKDAITRSQFDIKPSYAALRDSMSMQTLIGIVAGVVSVYDVCDALIDPENRGIESHGTKHGYDIGRPDHFNDASFAALIEDATKLEDTPDMNLSELIAIIDHVTFHTKAPLTIIKETMRIHTDVKLGKLEAALDAIRVRDETPTEPPYLSASMRAVPEVLPSASSTRQRKTNRHQRQRSRPSVQTQARPR